MRIKSSIIVPVIAIIAGVLLQLNSFGVIGEELIPADIMLKLWPLLLAVAALDLLLTLISNAKIDIHDIFVSEITEQYLEAMKLVDELDMDSASEFLQMAATLLEIKSRAMLPKPPKPEDPDELTPEQASSSLPTSGSIIPSPWV